MSGNDGETTIQTGGKFSVVPARAFADSRLKAIDIVVLGVLGITQSRDGVQRREGGFEISQASIAALSGIARPTVNKAVRRLREAGYLRQRVQVTTTGTRAPNLYFLVYDADLPAAHDRWSPVVADDGAIDVPDLFPPAPPSVPLGDSSVPARYRNLSWQTLPSESRGFPTVPGGDSIVLPGDHTVARRHLPAPPRRNTTVPSGDNAPVESTRSIQELIESSRAPTAAETVVNAFLRLRRQHYPGAGKRSSSREKLLAQAEEVLALGATVETIVETLAQRIAQSPDEGLDVPSGISRYRHDLRRAISRQDVGAATAVAPRPTRSKPPADDTPWRQLKGKIARRLGDEPVRTWLDVLTFVAVRSGVVQLSAPSGVIQKFALKVVAEGLDAGDKVEIAVGGPFRTTRES